MLNYRRKLRSRLLVTVFMGHNALRLQLSHRDRKSVRTFATPPQSPSLRPKPASSHTKPSPPILKS